MSENHTTAAVQRYLDALAGETPAEPLVRACWTGPSAGCSCCAPACSTAATPA